MRADDRILLYTRWVGVIIVPFLVAAFVLLYGFPTRTDELFAWTINPPLTAMFLASAYAGGIWFFVQVVRPNRWHHVRYGFPAVFVFATLLAISTFIHLDKFHFGHISFIVWITLYIVTPFLVFAAMIANAPADPRTPEERDVRIPTFMRILLAVVGLAALATGIFLFVVPQVAIDVWAWPLTPLTARVCGAILTLPGLVNVWMLGDSRWSAFRQMFQAQLASLVFIAGALAIRNGDLDWTRPSTPMFVIGIAVSFVVYAAFYLWCETALRRRRPVVSSAPHD
ncbi:hypothetical protein [Leifsonia sp. NPDC058230]|uniref:hypothetical protein n=1 Tax=Leifsonia sp. NPDC058230 TaxID=3346391 RepID=UPI0036DB617A